MAIINFRLLPRLSREAMNTTALDDETDANKNDNTNVSKIVISSTYMTLNNDNE